MWPNSPQTADLVTFTEEILNGKFHFLCSDKLRIKLIISIILMQNFWLKLLLPRTPLFLKLKDFSKQKKKIEKFRKDFEQQKQLITNQNKKAYL